MKKKKEGKKERQKERKEKKKRKIENQFNAFPLASPPVTENFTVVCAVVRGGQGRAHRPYHSKYKCFFNSICSFIIYNLQTNKNRDDSKHLKLK